MKYIFALLIGAGFLFINIKAKPKARPYISEDILNLIQDPSQVKLTLDNEIAFWETKLSEDHKQAAHHHQLGIAYFNRFQKFADIEDLERSKNSLLTAVSLTAENEASYLRSLARIYISLHDFQAAKSCITKALALGENKKASSYMLFDVQMELGQYNEAKSTLAELYHPNEFNYLIRKAKWKDYKGQLNEAINNMEFALDIAQKSKNTMEEQWLLTNLGDFYMHDNSGEKAYDNYIKALELDPHNFYALKAIAWLAYSDLKEAELALALLDNISIYYKSSDLDLFKAEILDYLGKEEQSRTHLLKFYQETQGIEMYRTHHAMILAEEMEDYDQALGLLQLELQSRPTPEIYDLIAWTEFLKGNVKKAYDIALNNVYSKTFEPTALYRTAVIFKHNGKEYLSSTLTKEVLSAELEIGPIMVSEITETASLN